MGKKKQGAAGGEMAAGVKVVSNNGCTFGKVLGEKVEGVQNLVLTNQDTYGNDKKHQQGVNRTLFDRTEKYKDELREKIHAIEKTLTEKIHKMDTGIRERIGKSEKKIAIIVVGGGVMLIVIRILLAKVFGVTI